MFRIGFIAAEFSFSDEKFPRVTGFPYDELKTNLYIA